MKEPNKKQISFCTIVTKDHFTFAKVTMESIKNTSEGEYNFTVLIVDDQTDWISDSEFCDVLSLKDLNLGEYETELNELKDKKLRTSFRWILKPFLVLHLLKEHGYVFWVDPDLYFCNNVVYSLKSYYNYNFILSPQYQCFDINVDPVDFPRNFYHGLFNGGFFGASPESESILKNWINMMLYKLEVNRKLGLFDDQGYMGIFHLIQDNIHYLKHRGFNLASWNRYECQRGLNEKGEVRINGNYEVVFIHFTKDTIKYILNGKDKLLRPHLREYVHSLKSIEPNLQTLKSYSIEKILRKTEPSS